MILEYYLPQQSQSNIELAKIFPDWDHQTFEQKVGIKNRHIVEVNETALDIGEKSAIKALAHFDKEKIDFVLLCTQSSDYFLPTSACILQDRLGLNKNCGALDYNLGCSGYVYGLALAKGLLASGIAHNVLLVVAETYSKHLHPGDRVNRAIFGDGAAATIVNNEDLGIGEFSLNTDGSGAKELIVRNGAFRTPKDKDVKDYEYGTGNITSDNHLYMNGPSIFNFTITKIPALVRECAKKNEMELREVDYFIFHQANQFMLEYLRKKIKIEPSKFCIELSDTGNTVSATIPIALKKAIDKGAVIKGNKIMLVGFGVGLSWGATIITL